MKELKIGIVGTDTSHVVAFTQLLNDVNDMYHIPGGKVVAAFPGGSPDFPLSISRVEGFMETLSKKYSVRRMETPEEVAASCDVILLESADGRIHLEQFRRIISYGKPIFIDKPLALTSKAALEIMNIAEKSQIPIMSCSSLRYAEQLTRDLERKDQSNITGAEVYGPLNVEPTQSYYFWYGIHSVEMLYAIMGPGCDHVSVSSHEQYDLITGHWKDGRVGTVRCNRNGDSNFGASIHREEGTSVVDIQEGTKPFYASLLEQVMTFFQTGDSPIEWSETVEIIRFLEAAEESKEQQSIVSLNEQS
ncbi:Gfo/Idh/MocA family protein [Paenibacillus sp. FA6]|uniref:Gfo/Idh/MocA family protein n=1 Tax=Paenibacillus sp. FA6 TaxID=3413029 RepID=UPI003F65C208